VQSDHLKGLVLTIIGVLALTPDTLLIRLAAADHWTLIFWRGGLLSLALSGAVIWQNRRHSFVAFRQIGWTGVLVGFCFGLNYILFTAALTYTSVAKTLIIVASTPMFAAIIAWFILSEKVPIRTLLAIGATFVGIVIVVSGGDVEGSLFGDFLALSTAIAVATGMVLTRKAKTISMVPATAAGGALAAVVALFLGSAPVLPASVDQGIYLALMGLFVLPVGFGLLTLGPRYIPAPEVGLILLLETVIGPLWVWFVLSEEPGIQVIFGGTIVVTALILHSVRGLQVAFRRSA
jgi:drug/metabolite transporter (DMT)-like permease